MKALVFIDHDIICRHFAMSGALSLLTAKADTRFVFPDVDGKRMKLNPATLSLGAPFEHLRISAKRQQVWRWLLYADQLRPRLGAHEAALRFVRWKTLGWKAALLLTLGSFWPGSLVLRAMVRKRLAAEPNVALGALLDREKPDVVLHPTVLDGVFINDLIVQCRERGVPLVLAMNSWDNPSTKRAVVGKPDWLLAWGEQTRDHAVRFMGLDPARVVPFGVAQFDIYAAPTRVDRAAFCAAHGIDPQRRIILFAGSNAQTDEFTALTAIDQAIVDGRLGNVSVIYRPHPWGGGGQGGARLANAQFHHIVIDRTMRDYLARLAQGEAGITLPDYRDTHDLLSAVDGVVSPLSTILLEAILHGKPVAAYTPTGENEKGMLVNNLTLFHFSEFLALLDMLQPRDTDALIAAMNVLADPREGLVRARRLKQAAMRYVAQFDRPWRERIVPFLETVAASGARR